MIRILALFLSLSSAGIPPLENAELAPLSDVEDFTNAGLDGSAFYALLRHALTWQMGDESGSTIPDYPALMQSPESPQHRGTLFLIEGTLARIRPVENSAFRQDGPWQQHWQQWGIQWGANETDVAVVYLVNPPAGAGIDQKVRLPARFLMVWRQGEGTETPSDYLVFVGHGAVVSSGANESSGPSALVLVIALVLAMVVVLLVLRQRIQRERDPTQELLAAAKARQAKERALQIQDPGPPLPEKSDEALGELQRRHDEAT